MTNDWHFQVLHKAKLKAMNQQNNRVRSDEELLMIKNELKSIKEKEHANLLRNIASRLEIEKEQEIKINQEKIRIQNKHIEENKVSYKINRELDAEKDLQMQKRKEKTEGYRNKILEQIDGNAAKRNKLLQDRQAMETFERKRRR